MLYMNRIFIMVGILLLMEISVGEGTSYVHANGQRIAKVNETGIYYYSSDHLGSTTAITDGNGEVVEEQIHLPFGERISDGEKYGFTGKELDGTGLIYFGARYYLSGIGRFITPDAARDGMNWYSYAANNPLKFVDPTGNRIRRPGPSLCGGEWIVETSTESERVTVKYSHKKKDYGYTFSRDETNEFSLTDLSGQKVTLPDKKPLKVKYFGHWFWARYLSVFRKGDKIFLSVGRRIYEYNKKEFLMFHIEEGAPGKTAYYLSGMTGHRDSIDYVTFEEIDLEDNPKEKEIKKEYRVTFESGDRVRVHSIGHLKSRRDKLTGGTEIDDIDCHPFDHLIPIIRNLYGNSQKNK